MDRKELLDKFCLLLAEVKTSKDPEDVEIALHMLKKAICMLSEENLHRAKELFECFEGTLKYDNFLTESEAMSIVEKFINQDGSKGPKWKDPEEVFEKIDEMGGKVCCEPHYNKWAMYVAMHKFASDNLSVITKWVGNDKEKQFEACYELALTQLKDKDRPNWIRHYYNVTA